jgi:hypothetical protein
MYCGRYSSCGDITPPESLMKTLTDRKIAQERNYTKLREKHIQRHSEKKLQCRYASRSCKGRPRSSNCRDARMHLLRKQPVMQHQLKFQQSNAEAIKVNANAEASKQL